MHKWDSSIRILLLAVAVFLTSCGPSKTLTAPVHVSEIEAYLDGRAEIGDLRGAVLIAQDGKVLLSKGYDFADRAQKIRNTPQTKFRLGSVTKQFTAMAILILQSQGKLDVQDRICAYLSECPADWEEITIHHLLTHTSGIPGFTEFIDYNRRKATPSPPEETIDRFKEKPLNFQPGESWRYSNSGYVLLGWIIERVSGQSYEMFLQENIFTPLQMKDTGYDHNQDDLAVGYKDRFRKADFIDMSIPYAAGALYSTVEDLYRWDQALYTEQLVPQDLLDEMFAAHAAIPDSRSSELAYGYGWMIGTEDGRRIYEHGGGIDGFVAVITRYPDDKTTIIILSNQQTTQIESIRRKLAQMLFGND